EQSQKGLAMNLAYMRGANNRVGMLLDGRYDFAVMSKLAARHHIEQGAPIQIAVELGLGSFLSSHIIVFHDKDATAITDGMKVGIDYDSIDHCQLTRQHCAGHYVTFVRLMYSQLVDKIVSGEIDAAIWNKDEISDKHPNINWTIIDQPSNDDTVAVLVADKNKPELCSLIHNIICPEEVLRIQHMVESQQMLPNY
ncbi:MAG: YhfZ family protein, partial [Angelakisella sp.]